MLDVEPDGRKVLRFLVFDCLVLDGRPLMHRTLDKRLGVWNPTSSFQWYALILVFEIADVAVVFQGVRL